MDAEPICLGGLPVFALTRREWAEMILLHAQKQKQSNQPPAFFTDVNGNVLSLAARDAQFRDILLAATGIAADSQPMVLFSRLLARRIPERLCGTDTILDIAALAAKTRASIFLLGGTTRVNAAAMLLLKDMYRNLDVCGYHSGYFAPEEEASIVEQICTSRPDVLFVALGVPKEQEFVARNRDRLRGVGAVKTVGATFDVLAGVVPRAPAWMQRAGLEWLFRLAMEPRRLFLRYAITNPHAMFLLMTRSHARWRP